MQITEIEIINFGKLSGIKETFSSGITELYKENGFGKTTMAHFIKVMLYGFDNEGSRKEITERKFYQPWNGGEYGGRISFTAKGKKYILIKTFGSKEKEDKGKLIEEITGLDSDDYSTTPGPELFGIDKESFVRSAFFGQGKLDSEVTPGIQNKADIGGDPTDITRFDDTIKRLRDNISDVKGRKQNSLVPKINKRITDIDARTRTLPQLEQKQKSLQDRIAEEKEKLTVNHQQAEAISQEMRKSSVAEKMLSYQKEYKAKLEEKNRRKQEYEENKAFFPKDIPSDDILKSIYDHIETAEEDAAKLELINWSQEDELALNSLSGLFIAGIPTEAEFDLIRQGINTIASVKEQISDNKLSDDELNTLKELEGLKNVSSDMAAGLIIDIDEYFAERLTIEAEQKNYLENKATLEKLKSTTKSSSVSTLTLAGCILIIAGIGTAFALLIAGIILGLAGAALTVYSLVDKKPTEAAAALKAEEEKLDVEGEKLESNSKQNSERIQHIHMELSKLGMDCDEDRLKSVAYDLSKKIERYEKLSETYEKYQAAGYENSLKEADTEVRKLLGKYLPERLGSSYDEVLEELRLKTDRYNTLLENRRNYNRHFIAINDHKQSVEKLLADIGFENVENPKQFLIIIKDKKRDYKETEEEYERYDKELKRFLEGKDEENIKSYIHDPEIRSQEELHALSVENTDAKRRIDSIIADLKQELEFTERELRDLDELSIDKGQLEEELLQANLYADMAEKTQDFLSRAKTNFTLKYTAPIMDSFRKYMGLVMPGTEDKYQMDADLHLSFREGAFNREISSLSAGLQDIVYLCLRGAMLDVMYTDDKPVLILDDPFVNLDDEKLPLAKRWLTAISLEYQVLYYCCHNSRKLEV